MSFQFVGSRSILWVLVAVTFSISAFAQFRAGVQGTVTDPAGAVVPDATITLTNLETNRKMTVASDANGFYSFNELSPGPYSLEAERSGFKKKTLASVTVSAEQRIGVNVELEVGQATQEVTVEGDVTPLIQTENASIDTNITSEEVRSLPQQGRDPYQLLRLAPGVFGTGARVSGGGSSNFPNAAGPGGPSSSSSIYATENQVPISANGQRVEANAFQLDGVNINSQAWGGAAVITPNQESVKEMRIVSSSYSAETGRNSGATVEVISQNGTNQFHGSAFMKINRPGLNAFQRWGGPHGEPAQRLTDRYNQMGGSVGGPIIKNRLFFFFSYDTLRSSSTTFSDVWVETPQFADVVRAAHPDSIAAQILSIPGMAPVYNQVIPRTCASVGAAPDACLDVNGGLDVGSPGPALGENVLTPVGGGLDGIPDIQFVQLANPNRNTYQQFNGRVDFQATQKDLLAFSMYYVPADTRFSVDGRPVQNWLSARRNSDYTALWTRTLTPALLNEARFNVTRWYFDELASNPDIPWGIPRDSVADQPFSGFTLNWGVGGPGIFYQTTYDIRDTVSFVTGGHSLKFGVDFTKEQNNDVVGWNAKPTYDFGNIWNFAGDAPITERNVNFNPLTGTPTELRKHIRSDHYAAFIQDDWKVRPNLTVNLGLRWEYFSPLRETDNLLSNPVLGTGPDPLAGLTMRLGGDLYEPDLNNFGPQLGFAWSPQLPWSEDNPGGFVVRGGFGVGFNRLQESLTLNGRFNPPLSALISLTGDDIVYSMASSLNSLTGWPVNPAAIVAFDPTTNLPLTGAPPDVFGIPRDIRTPYTYRYSLEIQQALSRSWVYTLGYQGSTSHKFPRTINQNLFLPRNEALNVVTFVQNDVNSNHNALLASLQHRFSRGFQFEAQYRWSKTMDNCSSGDKCLQSFPFDQRFEWAPADFDVTHLFKLYGVWEPPLFRARRDWLGSVAGGWQLTGILSTNSGFPWTPVYHQPDCDLVRVEGGLCPLRPMGLLGRPGDMDHGNDTFMSPGGIFPGGGLAYFVPPPDDSGFAPPVPGIGRNSFRGPRYFNVDMTASKAFALPSGPVLGENARLEIRANFFNIFNKLNLASFQWDDPSTQINHPDFGRAAPGLQGRPAALQGRVIEFQGRFSF